MIPAFINPQAGSAPQAINLLKSDSRFVLHKVHAANMPEAVRNTVRNGSSRILACGGDGTLALVAGEVAGTDTELAIFPGGTLNHFAARIDLPESPQDVLDIAAHGTAAPVDAGYVNNQIFLNTSSVGAYVHFVRTRNYLERRMSYSVASLVAGFRRFLRMRSANINLDGSVVKTPLVFVGVGERDVSFPFLGQDKVDGSPGLHIIAMKSTDRLQTLGIAFNAILRGIDPLDKARQVENRLIDSVQLSYARQRKKQILVALDGEIHRLRAPLKYEYRPAAFRVVRPDV